MKKFGKITLICMLFIFVLFTVMSWPLLIASEEKEITGKSFDLVEICTFDDGASREGPRGWIYGIPSSISTELMKDQTKLKKYPMWSALAFDGYHRFNWQSKTDLSRGKHRVVNNSIFDRKCVELEIRNVSSVDDIWSFARNLTQQQDTLICGWYKKWDEDTLSNHFIYIMNLRLCLFIKLALLT